MDRTEEAFVRQLVEEVIKTKEVKYNTVFGGTLTNKPEHMTHLRGNTLVFKDHPVIKYRGALDYLESKIICTQIVADKKGYKSLVDDLEEIITLVRKLIRVQITGEELGEEPPSGYPSRCVCQLQL